MKCKASHGDIYDIPEVFEPLFWCMDEHKVYLEESQIGELKMLGEAIE